MSGDKFVNDVRASSADKRYMGKPFRGTIAQAIKQAKAAPEPLPINPNAGKAAQAGVSASRYELLAFLRLLP